jgi:anti-sigma regulatory factor (Ser/Thr protein kinase)
MTAHSSVPTDKAVLTVRPTLSGFEEAARTLRDQLGARAIHEDTSYKIELAFEEVVTNILRHGHPTADISVTIAFDGRAAVLTFEDDGVPFDPRGKGEFKPPPSLDETPVGGLGLHLLRTIAQRVDYEHTPERHNRLTLVIALP